MTDTTAEALGGTPWGLLPFSEKHMQTDDSGTQPLVTGHPFPSDPTEAHAFAERMIQAIPEDWRKALEGIQTVFPDAVLAGGALRDHVLGRPVKDLDFFTCTGRPAFPDMALEFEVAVQAGAMQAGMMFAPIPRPMAGVGHAAVNFLFETTSEAGLPMQIVDLAPESGGSALIHQTVNLSDFGICRLATDGDVVLVHPHFIHDAQHRVFTLRQMNVTMEAVIERWRRLCVKYPGWGFVDAASDGAAVGP